VARVLPAGGNSVRVRARGELPEVGNRAVTHCDEMDEKVKIRRPEDDGHLNDLGEEMFKYNSVMCGSGKPTGGTSTWDVIARPSRAEIPAVLSQAEQHARQPRDDVTQLPSINNILGDEAIDRAIKMEQAREVHDRQQVHEAPKACRTLLRKLKHVRIKAGGNTCRGEDLIPHQDIAIPTEYIQLHIQCERLLNIPQLILPLLHRRLQHAPTHPKRHRSSLLLHRTK
jgi:hypothetical protein